MGGVISLYKPATLQPEVHGFVWCAQSHCLFQKPWTTNPKNTQEQGEIVGSVILLFCIVYLCKLTGKAVL